MLKWFKRLFFAFLLIGTLIVTAFIFREPLLAAAARAWIISDPLTHADAIVVLGGGPETRPYEAARLFHLGAAPKILLMNPRPTPSSELGLTPTDADLARKVLLKKQVPANAILITSDIVTNSFDEAMAVCHWAKASGARSVIIPTDDFHTRRVRWLFNKKLHPLGVQVEVESVPVREYSCKDWWQHEQGIIAFQNELLKYAYYRCKY